MNLLEVTDMRTAFRTRSGLARAVDGVSFRIDEGEVIGIVGESGSGKSVLMRSVMGLLLPNGAVQTGSGVRYRGIDLLALSPKQRRNYWGTEMAMVFQDPMTALNPVKRIDAQLTELMRVRLGLGRSESLRRATELLDQVGIADPSRRLRQYPHELSGGMRQRVTIARALAGGPRLLIADEPTTALDVTVQAQILDLLANLCRERNMAMILISHDLGVVADRTDRIAVMYGGRIVEWLPSVELFHTVRHPYTEGLLRSVPEIDAPSHTRLFTIAGQPPQLTSRPAGCSFAPRCGHAQGHCFVEPPVLARGPGDSRAHACHFPLGLAATC